MSEKISAETQQKIERLQSLEHTAQGVGQQKQTVQGNLVEIESALSELQNAKRAFKIVGGIMVETTPTTLGEELTSKKDLLTMRISSIEKQEKQVRDKIKSLQAEIMQALK